MNLKTLLVLVSLMVSARSAFAADDKLPEEWYGTWSGRLKVYAPDGTTFDRAMKLSIMPIADSSNFEWKMESEFRGKTSERNYLLVPNESKQGEFTIDEQNGIHLNAHLRGDTLYTYYLDGDILIAARYELRDNKLLMELSSIETSEPRISSPEGGEFQIKAYRLGAAQTGTLEKVTQE